MDRFGFYTIRNSQIIFSIENNYNLVKLKYGFMFNIKQMVEKNIKEKKYYVIKYGRKNKMKGYEKELESIEKALDNKAENIGCFVSNYKIFKQTLKNAAVEKVSIALVGFMVGLIFGIGFGIIVSTL